MGQLQKETEEDVRIRGGTEDGVRIDAEVLIVGTGPTGLTLANILGQSGVSVIVIDRRSSTVDEPRAVSIDDESLRTMQGIGLADAVLENVVEGYGVHYFTRAGGRCFGKVEPTVRDYGFPRRNAFRQPLFEAALREGLKRFPSVTVLFEHTLLGFTQDEHGVTAQVEAPDGGALALHSRFLVGCDGGRSTVRKLCGAALVGTSFNARWLVIDTERDNDPFWQTRVYCDSARAVVEVPGPHHTRRFELLLKPHETDEEMLRPERIKELLRPFRGDQETHIVRKIVYTFHARIADRWQAGRVFLAGDAAHLTPPYAGQGMNSGIRDAANLGWKLAAVLQGRLSEGALKTYETERRDHAWALIKLALNLGVVMAPSSWLKAKVIHAFFTLVGFVPPLRDYFLQMKFKPKPQFRDGLMLQEADVPRKRSIVGRMLPQPEVAGIGGEKAMIDDLLGPGFALLGMGGECGAAVASFSHPLWERLSAGRVCVAAPMEPLPPTDGPVRLAVAPAGALDTLLRQYRGKILLVRPDRYVAGVFNPGDERTFAARFESLLGDPSAGEPPASPGRPRPV